MIYTIKIKLSKVNKKEEKVIEDSNKKDLKNFAYKKRTK